MVVESKQITFFKILICFQETLKKGNAKKTQKSILEPVENEKLGIK